MDGSRVWGVVRMVALGGPTLAVLLAAALQPLHAYPADVVVQAAPPTQPEVGAAPGSQSSAAHAVSTANGEARYTVPIDLPPGRGGIEPVLALAYSSLAPIRGGVAAGWTLSIPAIRVDPSVGRLRGNHYLSTLNGAQRLIAVDEPRTPRGTTAYRAEDDAQMVRYQRIADRNGTTWRALTSAGHTYSFAAADVAQSPYGDEARWFLSSIHDRFGNAVTYRYAPVRGHRTNGTRAIVVDLALESIEYTSNRRAGIEAHARVWFEYAPTLDLCPGSYVPVGAQFHYGTGIPLYEGARRLDRIVVEVRQTPEARWQRRSELRLTYNQELYDLRRCRALHGPLRLLTAIESIGYDLDDAPLSRPTLRFTYGPVERTFDEAWPHRTGVVGHLMQGRRRSDSDKAGAYPTVDELLADIDGDGQPELVAQDEDHSTTACQYRWRELVGPDQTWKTATLPSIPWANRQRDRSRRHGFREGCTLRAQFSRRSTLAAGSRGSCGLPANYLSYRLFDFDGDGIQDIVSQLDFQRGRYQPWDDRALQTSMPPPAPPRHPPCRDHEQGGAAVPCRVTRTSAWVEPPASAHAGIADVLAMAPHPNCPDDGCLDQTCVERLPLPHSPAGEDPVDPDEDEPPVRYLRADVLACCARCPLDRPRDPSPPIFGGGGVWGETTLPPVVRNFSSTDAVDDRSTTSLACHFQTDARAGYYVLRVASGRGDGRFAPAQVRYSPIPLESPYATDNVGLNQPTSPYYAYADLTGDGCLDAVWQTPHGAPPEPGSAWDGDFSLFPGDCRGNFATDATAAPYRWNAPATVDQAMGNFRALLDFHLSGEVVGRATAGHRHHGSQRLVALVDINGDGLIDLVDARDRGRRIATQPLHERWTARVYYNTGKGFEDLGQSTVLGPSLPGLAAQETVFVYADRAVGEDTSWTMATMSQHDLDLDGLPDWVESAVPPTGLVNPWQIPSAASITAYINYGDHLIPVRDPQLARWRTGLSAITLSDPVVWKVKSGLIDLDGDGVPELLANSGESCRPEHDDQRGRGYWALCGADGSFYSDRAGREGLRLLQKVDNGRGGTIEFRYAPTSNRAVVRPGPDGRVQLPRPHRVVREVIVRSGHTPAVRTEYVYTQPVVNRDPLGRSGFRGFATTTTIGPSSSGTRAATVEQYRYDTDYRGRKVRTIWLFDADDPASAVTVSERLWLRFPLLGNRVSVVLPTIDVTWTCQRGDDEPTCRTAGRPAARQSTTWAAFVATGSTMALPMTVYQSADGHAAADGGPIVGYAAASTELASALDPTSAGVRTTRWRRSLVHSADVALLLTAEATASESSTSTGASTGTSTSTGAELPEPYHYRRVEFSGPPLYLPVMVIEGGGAAPPATVVRAFDDATGTLLRAYSANEVARGARIATMFSWDPFRLYPTLTTDPGFHLHGQRVDLAIGRVTRSGSYQAGTGWVLEDVRHDALGRIVERAHVVAAEFHDPGDRRVFERTTYDDHANPPSVRTERFAQYEATAQPTATIATFDGFGTVLGVATETDQGLAETHYRYDAAGNLSELTLPSPEGTGRVSYTYEYDSLHRLVRQTAPASAPVEVTYDGLRSVRSQVSADPAFSAVVVAYDTDVFGRLTRVVEDPDGVAAATTYRYGPLDTIRVIEQRDDDQHTGDAAGAGATVRTEIEYDYAGRRTAIVRGQRVWRYEYDRNGNMLAETVPGPADPSRAAGCTPDGQPRGPYSNCWTYDELDRVTSYSAGSRELDADDAQRYGLGTVHYLYDQQDAAHANVTGRLARVKLPFGQVDYSYHPRGLLARETRHFVVAPTGSPIDLGVHARDYQYNALDQPIEVTHVDDGAVSLALRTNYDRRGAPQAVWARRGPPAERAAFVELARVDRNLAGLPVHRASGRLAQRWSYDGRGAVLEHRAVGSCAGPGRCTDLPVAGEVLEYNDLGNVISQRNRTSGVAVTFAYDSQNQLVLARSDDASDDGSAGAYYAGFSYSPAGRLLSATLHSDRGAGGGVVPRDVNYAYGGIAADGQPADPAAVRRLVRADAALGDADPASAFAEYDYDGAGNLIHRRVGPRTTGFVYDGNDQLREAITSDGTREIYYYLGHQRVVAFSEQLLAQRRLRQWFGDTEYEHRAPGEPTTASVYVNLGATPVAYLRDGQVDRARHLVTGVQSHLLAVADNAGELLAAYSYGPFGEILDQSGADAAGFDRLFNGKIFDRATGLSYYGYRYYDRLSLTWTQADPLYRFAPDLAYDQPRRMGLYTFSGNNPLRYVDPDGRFFNALVGAVVGAFIGTVIEGVRQLAAGDFDARALAAAAAGGALAGSMAALTMGASLGAQAIGGGLASAAGGTMQRLVLGQHTSLAQVAQEFALGAGITSAAARAATVAGSSSFPRTSAPVVASSHLQSGTNRQLGHYVDELAPVPGRVRGLDGPFRPVNKAYPPNANAARAMSEGQCIVSVPTTGRRCAVCEHSYRHPTSMVQARDSALSAATFH
jgi:RHS repeat-associated protein